MANGQEKENDERKDRVTSGSLVQVIQRIAYRLDLEDYFALSGHGKFVADLLASKHFIDVSTGRCVPLDDKERLIRTEANASVVFPS